MKNDIKRVIRTQRKLLWEIRFQIKKIDEGEERKRLVLEESALVFSIESLESWLKAKERDDESACKQE